MRNYVMLDLLSKSELTLPGRPLYVAVGGLVPVYERTIFVRGQDICFSRGSVERGRMEERNPVGGSDFPEAGEHLHRRRITGQRYQPLVKCVSWPLALAGAMRAVLTSLVGAPSAS